MREILADASARVARRRGGQNVTGSADDAYTGTWLNSYCFWRAWRIAAVWWRPPGLRVGPWPAMPSTRGKSARRTMPTARIRGPRWCMAGELGMPIVREERKGCDGFLEGRTADGDRVRIYVEGETSRFPAEGKISRVSVRVAVFGDGPVSNRVLDQVGVHLVPPPCWPLQRRRLVREWFRQEPGRWHTRNQLPRRRYCRPSRNSACRRAGLRECPEPRALYATPLADAFGITRIAPWPPQCSAWISAVRT